MEQQSQQPSTFFRRKGYHARRGKIVDFFIGLLGMYFLYYAWGFLGSISFIADLFPDFLDLTFRFVAGFHFLALFYFWKRRRGYISWGIFTSGFIPMFWVLGLPLYLGILLGIVDWLFLPYH